jgi:hypothetical protein
MVGAAVEVLERSGYLPERIPSGFGLVVEEAMTKALAASSYAADTAETKELFGKIRQFVGQEVDGASRADLIDVEIAIDRLCARLE